MGVPIVTKGAPYLYNFGDPGFPNVKTPEASNH